MIRRRAVLAGLDEIPSPHDFRRAFCTIMHRKVKSAVTMRRLMGHSTTAVLERYIEDDDNDLSDNHASGSPVDNL
jgi:integrase